VTADPSPPATPVDDPEIADVLNLVIGEIITAVHRLAPLRSHASLDAGQRDRKKFPQTKTQTKRKF